MKIKVSDRQNRMHAIWEFVRMTVRGILRRSDLGNQLGQLQSECTTSMWHVDRSAATWSIVRYSFWFHCEDKHAWIVLPLLF